LAAGDRTVKKKLFENCHDAYGGQESGLRNRTWA
jgi:hypothetical protein